MIELWQIGCRDVVVSWSGRAKSSSSWSGNAPGVHHTVITGAWARFQQYCAPKRRRGQKKETIVVSLSRLKAQRHRFATQPNFVLTFKMPPGSVFQPKPCAYVCTKVGCSREDHVLVYGSRCLSQTTASYDVLRCAVDHVGWRRMGWFTDESRYCVDYGVLEMNARETVSRCKHCWTRQVWWRQNGSWVYALTSFS